MKGAAWTPAALGRLGNVADQVIATDLGITRAAVAAKRKRLGIAAAGLRTGPKPRGKPGRDVKVRLTAVERATLEVAAEGAPISTWLRDAGLAEARRKGRRR